MDARPTTQPEEGAVSASLKFEGEGAGRKVSPPWVSEKVRGKRAATDEPAHKKRKIVGAAPLRLGNISLGSGQITRTQSAAMSEWSNDDGAPVAPPLSTEVPPHNTRVEVPLKGGEGVPEQQAKETPMAEATRPPPQGTWVDPRAMPRGLE